MRHDILQDRKCIHLKLDKDVHAKLRAKMFQHGVSMQETLEEFAKALVTDDSRANKLLEALVMRKLRDAIAGVPKVRRTNMRVNELDHDALYGMIGEETPQ